MTHLSGFDEQCWTLTHKQKHVSRNYSFIQIIYIWLQFSVMSLLLFMYSIKAQFKY